MTSRRILALGAGAILALAVAGIALVVLLPGELPPPPAPQAAAPSPEAPAALAALAAPGAASSETPSQAALASPTLPAAATTGGARSSAAARRQPWADATTPWNEVPTVARPYELGPELARFVAASLGAARDQMTTCFDEEERAQASGVRPRLDSAEAGSASLVLFLETRDGGLDVVDSEVRRLGSSTRALVDCARHVLRGWPVAAPQAIPGRRYRMVYVLD